jgi:hypothetical protein
MRSLSITLGALAVILTFSLAACGSDSATAPSDPCSTSISDRIQASGAPNSRTDSGDTTTLTYDNGSYEFRRTGPRTCFVSDRIPNG